MGGLPSIVTEQSAADSAPVARHDGRVRYRPISPETLTEDLAEAITHAAAERVDGWLRVGIDGPPAAAPHDLAVALVDPLRVRGRGAQVVSAMDFLRPASVRLEQGHDNPDAYYEGWFDVAGLGREVLDPLGPGGSGRVLPTLWDAATDRATRAPYRYLPPGTVLLLSGPLLLGAGLALDYLVHLHMTPAALARRTAPDQRWTLPAYARYAAEVAPESFADVVIRADDLRHPAAVFR
jgi:hypothetical protein